MAEFYRAQLDYILFFYGLAFILLGVVCFAIERNGPRELPWAVLGSFGIAHGASEWLDLLAFSLGDAPVFALARLVVMAASYVMLLEFARLGAIRLGRSAPARWIYGPILVAVALGGITGGPGAANAVARYTLGLTGGIGTALVFAVLSRELPVGEKRWAISAAAGLALYGIAAGAIVPAAPFWPALVLNYDGFFRATGMPIQLLRGLLACWAAFSVWGFARQAMLLDAASSAYAREFSDRSAWVTVAMAAVLGLGWELTGYLGGEALQDLRGDVKDNLNLLVTRLYLQTTAVDDVVRSMAESPWLLPALTGGGARAREDANTVADLSKRAAGENAFVYLMDSAGTVIASSSRWEKDSPVGKNFRLRPYFRQAIAGDAAYYFALGVATGERGYYASHPVRDAAGRIVGVAVIKKLLDPIEAELRRTEHAFLIDPNGVVFLASHPEMPFRMLWPLPAETRLALSRSRQFGDLRHAPVLDREIGDGNWVVFEGERHYAGRRYTGHDRWSFVELKSPRTIAAARLFGITITLLFAIVTAIYFVGMERLVRDKIALAKRLELEEQARQLDLQASTDPLTGAFNRLKFNQELAAELARSARYKTPLSVVMFDIDHFKAINDTYGHQRGDAVLVGLCRIVAGSIRQTDVLARWGGEEFMILASHCDAAQAFELAEKLRQLIGDFAFDEAGTVTCSFGVAQFREGDSAQTLTSRADQALYAAKRAGRNRVCSSGPEQNAEVRQWSES